ncbi:MAG: helix-turn-helix transcriptional regulator [Propionibacteriales bacterium]|nr:helix-turn-helix transcriptional regulator [Propionibacteriales bacterium]
MAAKRKDPTESARVEDPRILRAIAHPVRNRILGELSAAGHLRAADVADVLDIPANQASFHLRQLAKYGLVELAPELARDGRDRVWRPVHEHGLTIELSAMEKGPGGKEAVAVWQRQAAAVAKAAIDRAYASRSNRAAHVMISDDWIRLTKAEAKELSEELMSLQERWQDRSQARADDGRERRTYHVLKVVQPAPEVES